MQIALAIIIIIHSLIHLFGFLKAFGISEFNEISVPISKPYGILWLCGFILFLATAALILFEQEYWWILGILAILLSQFLIIVYWNDAKFGTILNIIIAIAIILNYSSFNFQEKIDRETAQMLENAKALEQTQTATSEQQIAELPDVVQKWLTTSGILKKEKIQTVYLEQEAQLLMEPEQEEWNNANARQYITTVPPAFNWSVNLSMNSFIEVAGRDKFENGKGEMLIKIFSIFPVVDEKNNNKIDQAALQRYLAEIVWLPSAALSQYITWDEIDDNSARATMTYNGTQGSGVFYFDDNGYFQKFVTMRYRNPEDKEPTEWIVTSLKTESRNGILIPVECEATWKLASHNWTWLKIKITSIEYNF